MKKDNCPICTELLENEILNNYDEPPESKTYCEKCGFNEYYFYYEGCSTYMLMAVPKEKDKNELELKGFLVVEDEKNFISRDEYQKMFVSYLKENNLTLDFIIEARKELKEQKDNKRNRLKLEEEAKLARWTAGNLLESEKAKINEFLSNQKKMIEKLGEGIKITKEEKDENGLLFNLKFEFNFEELEKLASSKANAQHKYCVENKIPMFAPTNSCYSCGSRIFSFKKSHTNLFGKSFAKVEEPISLERCSTSLITGCPSCNRSFVD